jgi:cytochrome c553
MRPRRRWLAWAVLPLAVMGVGDPAVALADVPPGAQACLACHAPGLASTGAGAVPVPLLGGQQEEYLVKQLRNFRDGERGLAPSLRSGHELAAGPLRALAAYFAAQQPAPTPTKALDAPGRRLYLQGDAQRNVPACASSKATRSATSRPVRAAMARSPRTSPVRPRPSCTASRRPTSRTNCACGAASSATTAWTGS